MPPTMSRPLLPFALLALSACLCSPAAPRPPEPRRLVSPNSLPTDVTFIAEMKGEQLKAFAAAYEALQAIPDLAASKKRLENYTVRFVENKDNYYITFDPRSDPIRILPDGSSFARVGAETIFGRNVRFTVTKTDFKVIRAVTLI